MPLVPKTAPSRFRKFVNTGLKDLIESSDIFVYMNDILVTNETVEHHLIVLKRIFKLFVENKMEIWLDRCEFLFNRIQFLSYVLSEEGIRLWKSELLPWLIFQYLGT